MLIVSQILCRTMNFIHPDEDSCVKIVKINCNWSVALCDNYNQSTLPCGPDEVLIRIHPGPVTVFHTFTENIHTALMCVMSENLVNSLATCVSEKVMCTGNHSQLLFYQWLGLLVLSEWMSVWDSELLILLDLHYTLYWRKEIRSNCLILWLYHINHDE